MTGSLDRLARAVKHRRCRYTVAMRFRCIVSYRTSRSKGLSTWRTYARGSDLVGAVADAVMKLKRRMRRQVTVVGMYVQEQAGGNR